MLPIRFSLSSVLLGIAFIAVILAAYCRGNYLLGMGVGITYAIVASLIVLLAVRALRQTPVPKMRIALLVLFAVPVGFALAFPAHINPDVQVFINKQTVDRNARSELTAIFATDPAFSDFGISTTHLKCINVEVHGSVPTKEGANSVRNWAA
jgi:hypothetical protein